MAAVFESEAVLRQGSGLSQVDRCRWRALGAWMKQENVKELWCRAVTGEWDERRESIAWLQARIEAKFKELCPGGLHYPLLHGQ
jgi:hypothetical protein